MLARTLTSKLVKIIPNVVECSKNVAPIQKAFPCIVDAIFKSTLTLETFGENSNLTNQISHEG